MENVLKKSLLVLAVAVALSACNEQHPQPIVPQYVAPQPQVVQAAPAAAPVIINQAAPAHSGDGALTGAIAGGALGYMLGKGSSNDRGYDRPQTNNTTVINKTVVVKQYVQEPAKPVAPAPAPTPAPVVAPTPAPLKSAPVVAQSKFVSSPTPPSRSLSLAKSPAPSRSSFGGFNRRK